MTTVANHIIDGKLFAAALRSKISAEVEDLKRQTGKTPGLAVVLVGDDPASRVYVANKHRQTEEAGMSSLVFRLPEQATQAELLALIDLLNTDETVHGILIQLPLPAHIDAKIVIDTVSVGKDVDGFHATNAGRLATGQSAIVPCTPLGCVKLLKGRLGNLSGLRAVILGRSNIVGKPMAQLLIAENCTVTVAHSQSRDLPAICRNADILVAAVGKPEFVRGDWIKPGAVVIDVGINRIKDQNGFRLVGDVATSEAGHAAAITPVPGGVGPMTIACLLSNTLEAFQRSLAERKH